MTATVTTAHCDRCKREAKLGDLTVIKYEVKRGTSREMLEAAVCGPCFTDLKKSKEGIGGWLEEHFT